MDYGMTFFQNGATEYDGEWKEEKWHGYGRLFDVDVDSFWQFLAVGVVIIVAVLIDQSRTRVTGETNE